MISTLEEDMGAEEGEGKELGGEESSSRISRGERAARGDAVVEEDLR